jgi:hypothetical protein
MYAPEKDAALELWGSHVSKLVRRSQWQNFAIRRLA